MACSLTPGLPDQRENESEEREDVNEDEVCLRIPYEASSSQSDTSENLKCPDCNLIFQNAEDSRRHFNSKEHEQKIRKSRTKFLQQVRDSTLNKGYIVQRSDSSEQGCSLEQQPLEGLNDYNGKIDTYRLAAKKTFSDGYLSYIYSAIAHWAINLTFDPTVSDFSVSVNQKEWHPFGTVSFKVQYVKLPGKDAVTIDYVIQFKHVVSNNAISLNSFTGGIFDYEEFIRQILNIKNLDSKDLRFYVFTTATIAPNLTTEFKVKFCKTCKSPKVACKCRHAQEEGAFDDVEIYGKSLTNGRNLSFNTSDDNGSVYRLFPISRKGYKVPSLYMYTSQKPQRELAKSINDGFADFLDEVHPRLARNFIKFVERWFMKNMGKLFKFKMKKEDVLVNLGEVLLDQYRVTPKIENIKDQPTRFPIWIQAIKSADITITQISKKKLSNLLEPFNVLIEHHLNTKIQIASDCYGFEDTIRISPETIKNLEDSPLKFYISDETSTDNISHLSLTSLQVVFWRAGLMPLTLRVDKSSQEHVFQVINLLKTRGLIRRYLVNSSDENIRISARSWKNLTFFINLGDIADKLGQTIMDSVAIKLLTPRLRISLGTIQRTDPFFQNSILPYEFFEMVLNKYQMKMYKLLEKQQEVSDKLVLPHELILSLLGSIENTEGRDRVPLKELRNVKPDLFAF